MFEYIIDKVRERTQGWNKKFLSAGGKEVLLKSVALALPVYSMNIFKFPKSICEEINATIAKFWWSNGEDKKECIGLLGNEWECRRKKEVWDLETSNTLTLQCLESKCGEFFKIQNALWQDC